MLRVCKAASQTQGLRPRSGFWMGLNSKKYGAEHRGVRLMRVHIPHPKTATRPSQMRCSAQPMMNASTCLFQQRILQASYSTTGHACPRSQTVKRAEAAPVLGISNGPKSIVARFLIAAMSRTYVALKSSSMCLGQCR